MVEPSKKCRKLFRAMRKASAKAGEKDAPPAFGSRVWNAHMAYLQCEGMKAKRCVAMVKELAACHKSVMGAGVPFNGAAAFAAPPPAARSE